MEAPKPIPLPPSLPSVILSYLIPAPNAPLPPEILSLSLTQLHTYLPPALDDPIAHFLPSAGAGEDLKAAIGDAVHEVARLMGEGEHPSLEPTYAFPDPVTLQSRIQLFATSDFSRPSLELIFVYEGPERSWRLEGLRLPSAGPPGVRWGTLEEALRAGKEAVERLAQEQEREEAKGEDEHTEDFWAGYAGSPPPAQEAELARSDSSASVADDYWAQYGQVDDHVGPSAASAATSPKVGTGALPNGRSASSGRSSVRGSGDGRGKSSSRDRWNGEAWGTGGETPVGWTPVLTPEHFINDPRNARHPNAAQKRQDSALSARSDSSQRYPFPAPDLTGDEGSFPVFPEPDFKGLTPASMTPNTPPEMPSRLPLGHTILAPAAPSSSASFDHPSPPDQAPIKLTLPDFAAPRRGRTLTATALNPSLRSTPPPPPPSALHAALAGVYALHLSANPDKTREQASADWLKVALEVVAAQSGAVVNLDETGDESPGQGAQTPVGAVGPFGL